jgi:multicomponent Na+:H+ antiporter subunit C
VTILLALVTAVLFGCGSWLLMQRRLSRIIVGIGLLGHGANMLLITSGRAGRAPIIDGGDGYADPLPQALALTAIVITFGVTAFLLALGFRSWQLTRDDRVEDDVEDRIIARRQPDRAEDHAGPDPEDTFGPDDEPGARPNAAENEGGGPVEEAPA